MKQRKISLDFLRIAALLVIFCFHFLYNMVETGNMSLETFVRCVQTQNIHFATLSVGVFFLLSGFGLMYSSRNHFSVGEFFRKRMIRIYVPFYLAYLVLLVMKTAAERGWPFPKEISWWKMLLTAAGVDEYFSMMGIPTFSFGIGEWFLGCLILLYLLFPLLRLAMLKQKELTLLGGMGLYLLAIYVFPSPMDLHQNLLVKLFEFLLGMYMAMICEKITWKASLGAGVIFLLILLLPVQIPVSYCILITLMSLCLTIAVFGTEELWQNLPAEAGLLKSITRYSFCGYLIHHKVIFLVGNHLIGRELTVGAMTGIAIAEFVTIAAGAVVLQKLSDLCIGTLYRITQ